MQSLVLDRHLNCGAAFCLNDAERIMTNDFVWTLLHPNTSLRINKVILNKHFFIIYGPHVLIIEDLKYLIYSGRCFLDQGTMAECQRRGFAVCTTIIIIFCYVIIIIVITITVIWYRTMLVNWGVAVLSNFGGTVWEWGINVQFMYMWIRHDT